MTRILLQDMIEPLKFDSLPANWNSFDLEGFSKNWKLWDYQKKALENAIKVLCKYFEDFEDYQKTEKLEVNKLRKQKFFKWYTDNGLEEDLNIGLDKGKKAIYNLLTEYYLQEKEKIPYEYLINRMSFWMATGSGKSLVIVKLIQILKGLMELGEVPPWDILILTHRDDLIEQLRRHVEEFNYTNNEIHIRLKELKDYPEVKKEPRLFKKEEIIVFYYRSDNLSDEQKEKIIDFRNYDNDGRWYIFLDEAHKGDKEDSKRQHIYSILSRNGFLFNSSATFTDPRDIITCAYEFNLSSFIKAGYGKHLSILKQEIKAFKGDGDYSDEEKQKIVLKSLLLLSYAKKFHRDILKNQSNLYHSPLLLTLVNSVNTEDADLMLFFRELERIGKGDIEEGVFKAALEELWQELKSEPGFIFEDEQKVKIDEKILKNITRTELLNYAYNSSALGEIEILVRPSDKKELAFKLKTSDKPFALIKIGDISGWLKDKLAGYEVNEKFEDESYFESLNREDSDINILMGSRSFYEGWDSNRPNIINFINIGVGEDARKFILQSVGRGVRIEPVKNKRKRLLSLYNSKEMTEDIFNKIKDKVLPLETLFIFGTNRKALETVITELQREKMKGGVAQQLSLFLNLDVEKYELLAPTYREAVYPSLEYKKYIKFPLSEQDLSILEKYLNFISDDRVLAIKYSEHLKEPREIKILRESLNKKSDFFAKGEKKYNNLDVIVRRLFDCFRISPKEFDKFEETGERIKHFKNIVVELEDINEIQKKIEKVKNYPKKKKEWDEKALKYKMDKKEINEIQQLLLKEASETYKYENKEIKIQYVAHHYYIPLILTDDVKVNYIKHIIKTRSEFKFINELESYLNKKNNKFDQFDWWLFSKLDENLDEVYIPYFGDNKIRNFYPDFIFWLVKDSHYYIVFVDPKGTEFTDAERKIDGYVEIFEEKGKVKILSYNSYKVKVKLFLMKADTSKIPTEKYKQYWFDDIEKMIPQIV